jgi:hypothetical protein
MGYWKNSDVCCLKANGYLQNPNHPLPHGKWVVAKFRHPFPKGKCVLENSDITLPQGEWVFSKLTSLASRKMGIGKL